MDINLKTKKIVDKLGIEAVYLEEEIEILIRSKGISNEKFIFVDFSKAFENTNPDDLRMNQFEIAFQILLNRGYQLSIYNDDYEKHHFFENFVENFKDARIEYLKFTNEKELIEKMMFAGLMITFHKERLFYPLLLENKFLYIARGDLDENSNYLETAYLKIDDSFQAGKLLEKIKSIIENEGFFIEEIEVLRSDLNVDLDQTGTSLNSLEECQVLFKQNIKAMIENGLLEEVKPLILQYEQIAPSDLEVYSIKGIVTLMNENFDQAESIFLEGLKLNDEDYDLNYNLGYLYENKNNLEKSLEYYRKARNILNMYKDYDKYTTITQKIKQMVKKNEKNRCESYKIDSAHIKQSKIVDSLNINRNNFYQSLSRQLKFTATVVVWGYNRLEKTKKCVESVLKWTDDVDYELILVNHGSTDETLAYYESVDYRYKTIVNITKNVNSAGGRLFDFILENRSSKYLVVIPNDVYVTPNWLTNLLRCMESDPRIGWVVPASTNVSNCQELSVKLDSLDSLYEFAKKYNQSDSLKWEERMRLVNVLSIFRKEIFDMVGRYDPGFVHDFGEDDYSIRLRRNGYRLIFCGDTIVQHDHDFRVMEDKNEQEYSESLRMGWENYKEKYKGIDAWSDILNFEFDMVDLLVRYVAKKERINILGVDVRCGAPLFTIQNALRKLGIVEGVHKSAYTTQAKYFHDLETVCDDQKVLCDRIEYIKNYQSEKYDLILLGNPINEYEDSVDVMKEIIGKLLVNGRVVFKVSKENLDVTEFNNLVAMLLKEIEKQKCKILDIKRLIFNISNEEKIKLQGKLNKLKLNTEKDFLDAVTKEYIICIER